MKSALEQGIAVVERKYDEAELMNADEIIITSSSKIARGVRTIDGISVGGRAPDLLKKLQDDLFNDYILATSALS
jgi:D-alanine transaminase